MGQRRTGRRDVIRALLVDVLAAIGWFVLTFYVVVNVTYVGVHLTSLFELKSALRERSWEPVYEDFSSPFLPEIAVVVPAYNEGPTIVDSVGALCDLNYPSKEIVVVNDGSTDDTLDKLIEAFALERIDALLPLETNSEPVREVYRSKSVAELTIVDKANGGKGDALNAGIWIADAPLFCALDADSLIDRDGLLQAAKPFLRHPDTMVATGGTVRVVNGSTIEHNQVTDVSTSRTTLAGLQEMEYLRAFYAGRLGLSWLQGLILISGAFGLFRTDLVREVGGYDPDSITEDFELVVRLHRYLIDEGREYRVEFVPEPVVWTQVPAERAMLSRQRRRWYRGLIDTLWRERDMIANPRYGRVGLFALPVFVLAEAIGPLLEGAGYVLVPLAFLLGAVDVRFFVLFLAVTTGVGVFLSWFGVLSEVYSFRRYDDPRDVLVLMGHGVIENFGYRQWKALVAWKGLYEYLRGNTEWGEMTRQRFSGAAPAGADAGDGLPASATAAVTPDSMAETTGEPMAGEAATVPATTRAATTARDANGTDGVIEATTSDEADDEPSEPKRSDTTTTGTTITTSTTMTTTNDSTDDTEATDEERIDVRTNDRKSESRADRVESAGARFESAEFTGADFSGARFGSADFTETTFTDSDFTNARFGSAGFAGAKFTDSDFTNARFEDADLTDTEFVGARFENASFGEADLTDARFENAAFDGADFSGVDFRNGRDGD